MGPRGWGPKGIRPTSPRPSPPVHCPPADEPFWQADTLDKGHGRLERRRLTATTALQGYLDWPGVRQGFRLERRIVHCRTGAVREEVLYGLTSLPPVRASAAALLTYTRAHWRIENRSHWVRDVTFDEDRSQVRVGSMPQVLAALRHVTLSLVRLHGVSNLATACRHYAANPWKALALLGLPHNN